MQFFILITILVLVVVALNVAAIALRKPSVDTIQSNQKLHSQGYRIGQIYQQSMRVDLYTL